jgi:sarcosine oxidase
MTAYDVAVVGIGMIGSAALRALAEAEPRLRVVGVGPAEPADWASYPGPFASHYDHARITRVTDPDRIWAELARRSIAAYPEIAARGGVTFHFPAGHLRLGRGVHDPALAAAEVIGHELGAPVERLDAAGLAARFPALRFPEGAAGLHEGGGSGWISPRNLVAAQLAAAGAAGAALVRDTVTAIRRHGGGFALETRGGERVAAGRVVVSADGNAPALLAGVSGRTLRLERQAHTTVLAELAEGQATALAGLPSTIWPLAGHPVLPSVYTTPAARYPDGRWYLKIGAPLHEPHLLESDDAVRTWFQSPGNPVEIAALQGVLLDLFPGLEVAGWRSKPCMNTYTAHGYPYVDRVEPGLFVCTGGCGAAAKSSDAIGRLGAMLARGDTWDDRLPAESFRAVYM